MNFSWTQISELLGVSHMNVYRRRRDFGILDFDELQRNVSDNELHRLLQQLCREISNMGEVLVIGRLHAMALTPFDMYYVYECVNVWLIIKIHKTKLICSL